MSGQWIYWVGWMAGLGFLIAMVAMARWALFAGKPRGRLRCPKCWYDMTASPAPGLTCSECGNTVRSKNDLTRTRRRWGKAVLAISACTTLGLWVIVHTNERGWFSIVPTRALIAMIPFDADGQGALFEEFEIRNNRLDLSRDHFLLMFDRFVAGDWWARPVSEAWVNKYGRLIDAWRRGAANDSELAARLIQLPPRMQLTADIGRPASANHRWLGVQVHDWWPGGTDSRIVIAPGVRDAAPITIFRGEPRGQTTLAIPLPCNDHDTVDVRIERKSVDSLDDWIVVDSQTLSFPAGADAATHPSLQPASDRAIDLQMIGVFSGQVVQWTGGPSPVRFRYSPWATYDRAFDDVAIGAEIELRHDDVVARRLRMWWRGGGGRGASFDERDFGAELPQENLDLLAGLVPNDPRWTMRVRGVESLAARVPGATKYWSGEFLLPISVDARETLVRDRSWWTDEPIPVRQDQ